MGNAGRQFNVKELQFPNVNMIFLNIKFANFIFISYSEYDMNIYEYDIL